MDLDLVVQIKRLERIVYSGSPYILLETIFIPPRVAFSESTKSSDIYYEKAALDYPLQVEYNYWKELEIEILRQHHQRPLRTKHKIL